MDTNTENSIHTPNTGNTPDIRNTPDIGNMPDTGNTADTNQTFAEKRRHASGQAEANGRMSEDEPSAIVSDIQRFSIHDGPGVRTTVFLKGCNLRCRWCHNPETNAPQPQVQLSSYRCLQCGRCADVCPEECHRFSSNGGHFFDSSRCRRCFACSSVCPAKALTVCGKRMTAKQIIAEAEKDRAFYGEKGGLTLSGGEPMLHHEAALEILRLAKASGLNTCVETAGLFNYAAAADAFLRDTDHIFWDVKFLDSELHREYCGVDNRRILENLTAAAARRPDIVPRTVIARGITDNENHVKSIAAFTRSIGLIHPLVLLPFHPFGSSKADAIGQHGDHMNEEFIPEETTMDALRALC